MRAGVEVKAVAPLISWDIFIQSYRRTQQLADDRNTLLKMARKAQWQQTFDYDHLLFQLQKTILITTPAQKILFASSSLYAMNGYLPREVIGHTPRIFQGTETSAEHRSYINQAITEKVPFETTAINYRKDGSLYQCHIKGFPLFNRNNQLVHFIAFESGDQ